MAAAAALLDLSEPTRRCARRTVIVFRISRNNDSPSIGAAPSNRPKWVAFHPWGVSSVSGAVAGEAHDGERNAAMRAGVFMTLTEISATLGHSDREIAHRKSHLPGDRLEPRVQ